MKEQKDKNWVLTTNAVPHGETSLAAADVVGAFAVLVLAEFSHRTRASQLYSWRCQGGNFIVQCWCFMLSHTFFLWVEMWLQLFLLIKCV